jgi:hypothetical protein
VRGLEAVYQVENYRNSDATHFAHDGVPFGAIRQSLASTNREGALFQL